MSKYVYASNAREISGFGGGYEDTCRNMVIAGMEWIDENPKADLNYKECKQIYGITFDESEDCQKMQAAMLKAPGADGCTGAMMQATMGHIMYAHKNGWEKYMEEMTKEEKEAQEG